MCEFTIHPCTYLSFESEFSLKGINEKITPTELLNKYGQDIYDDMFKNLREICKNKNYLSMSLEDLNLSEGKKSENKLMKHLKWLAISNKLKEIVIYITIIDRGAYIDRYFHCEIDDIDI